jgi:RIO-like serine/threonine protein kinase
VHGDLVEFLKVREPRGSENDEKERIRNAEDFLRISAQIVEGMEYLAIHQQFVHRDLAARNCLVGDQQVIKIGDFARMKPQYENEYYKVLSKSLFTQSILYDR